MSSTIRFIVYVVVLLVFQEIFFRSCFPLPELSNFDRGLYAAGKSGNVSFVRNRSFFWESSLDTNHRFIHQYNMYGFRDEEWNTLKPKGTQRILFIGDSYVESVMSEKTLTEYFEQWDSKKKLDAMNAGMLGTGMSRYLMLLSDMVPLFHPDHVILVVYANDFMYEKIEIPEFFKSAEYYSTWTPRLVELIRQWKRGAAVPLRWRFRAKPLLVKAGERTFAWNNIQDQMSEFGEPHVIQAMKCGNLNSYRLNELHREEGYLKKPAECIQAIDYFRYYSEKFGFRPYVIFVPSRNQITDNYLPYEFEMCNNCDSGISLTKPEYNQVQLQLARACSVSGIPFLDLSSVLAAQEAQGNRLFWNYDGHLNDKGTKLIAEQIYKSWFQVSHFYSN